MNNFKWNFKCKKCGKCEYFKFKPISHACKYCKLPTDQNKKQQPMERKTLEYYKDQRTRHSGVANCFENIHFTLGNVKDRIEYETLQVFHHQEMKAKDEEIQQAYHNLEFAESINHKQSAEIQSFKQQLSDREHFTK